MFISIISIILTIKCFQDKDYSNYTVLTTIANTAKLFIVFYIIYNTLTIKKIGAKVKKMLRRLFSNSSNIDMSNLV